MATYIGHPVYVEQEEASSYYLTSQLFNILSRTIWTVVYVGPQICSISTTDAFIKDRMWSL